MKGFIEKLIERLMKDKRIGRMSFEATVEIVNQLAEEYENGHFGCNSNGEHEKCEGCPLYDCKRRNKTWFVEKKNFQNRPTQTNADRIRAMSDDELAEFIVNLNEHCLAGIGAVDCSKCNGTCEDNCKKIVRKWLQYEAE